MYLFLVTEDLVATSAVSSDNNQAEYAFAFAGSCGPESDSPSDGVIELRAPRAGRLTNESVYAAFSVWFLRDAVAFARSVGRNPFRLLDTSNHRRLIKSLRVQRLGWTAESPGQAELNAFAERRVRGSRVLIVNRFGAAIGDTVVFLAALEQFVEKTGARVAIAQHAGATAIDELYLRSGLVETVLHLPLPAGRLEEFDAYIDLTANYGSRGLPWIDEMLELLGLNPSEVPKGRRTRGLRISAAARADVAEFLAPYRSTGRPLVLLHPRASARIRSMPDDVAGDIAAQIADRFDATIFRAVRGTAHPSITDCADVSRSIDHFAALVEAMDGVVCVDTSCYHMAATCGVPSVVVFASIDPAYRTAYYDRVATIRLGDEDCVLRGKSEGEDEHDFAVAAGLWRTLDARRVVRELERVCPKLRTSTRSAEAIVQRTQYSRNVLLGP